MTLGVIVSTACTRAGRPEIAELAEAFHAAVDAIAEANAAFEEARRRFEAS